MSTLAKSFGLSLRQTSFQLSYIDRVVFLSENILKVISLSLLAGIPIIVLLILQRYKFYKLFVRLCTTVTRFKVTSKKIALNQRPIIYSLRRHTFIKGILIVSLMLLIILTPRLEMLSAQGGLYELKENQLKMNYKSIYKLIMNPPDFKGDVLTFRAPMGLPYYLYDIKVIDLALPANLAFLKDCFQSITPSETVLKLKRHGIRYLLINPSIIQQLDALLNFTVSKIIENPELATLTQTYGNWQLYELE